MRNIGYLNIVGYCSKQFKKYLNLWQTLINNNVYKNIANKN